MDHLLANMFYWHWIGLAAILFILEVLTGTGLVLWTGISALMLGLMVFAIPTMTMGVQWITFAVLSLLSAICWNWYLRYRPIKTDDPSLNRRANQYIGRVFTLESATVNGMGTLHVDDTMWRIQSAEDLPAGMLIRIKGADGVILIAEAASPNQKEIS